MSNRYIFLPISEKIFKLLSFRCLPNLAMKMLIVKTVERKLQSLIFLVEKGLFYWNILL